MGGLLVIPKVETEPGLDRLAVRWRAWIDHHRSLARRGRRIGHVASWVALVIAIAGLAFSIAARDLLAQMLWSLYLMWQVFILARSKSVTWRLCGAFFFAGALLVAPLAVLSAGLVHVVFGGAPGDAWSAVGWAAFSEEVLKLAPLIVFLAGTRRARSLGLADHALLGAATGAGFQFAEEATRRLVVVAGGAVPGDAGAHWAVFTLFPGSFVDARGGRVLAGHAVLTALVALAIGLARRYQRPERGGLWVLPGIVLLLAILDHAAYNGRDLLPGWLLRGHDIFGAGYVAGPLLLMLLVTAVAIDYRGLHRLGDRLPRLLGERRVEPFREARLLLAAAPAGLPAVSNLLAFLTERRVLGYGLLFERTQSEPEPVEVPIRLGWHRQRLGALLAGSAGMVLAVPVVPLARAAVQHGAVANLLHILTASWSNLGLWEQVGALAVLPTLLGFSLGRWTGWLLDPGVVMPDSAQRATAPQPAGTSASETPPSGPATGEHGPEPAPAVAATPAPLALHGSLRVLRRPRTTVPPRLAAVVIDCTPGALFAQQAAAVLDAGLRRIPADDLSRRLASDTFPRRPARVDVVRLFRGGIDRRGRSLGFHHRGSIGSQATARLVPGTQTARDRHGVRSVTPSTSAFRYASRLV